MDGSLWGASAFFVPGGGCPGVVFSLHGVEGALRSVFSEVKTWMAGRVLEEVETAWRDAMTAWRDVLARGPLEEKEGRALWSLLVQLRAAVGAVQEGVREARTQATDPQVRRALSRTAYALAVTEEQVEGPLLRYLESRVGYPPKDLGRRDVGRRDGGKENHASRSSGDG